MDILSKIDDAYETPLQTVADKRVFADISALCFAPVVELAKAALAETLASEDAAMLEAVKANPDLLASVKAAVSIAPPSPPILVR